MTAGDLVIAVAALAAGAIGTAIWTRWRHRVVDELRAIHRILDRHDDDCP